LETHPTYLAEHVAATQPPRHTGNDSVIVAVRTMRHTQIHDASPITSNAAVVLGQPCRVIVPCWPLRDKPPARKGGGKGKKK
jgi:hypothetical protein